MDRHPRAQNAYAPWASMPGTAATPPSYVWPSIGCQNNKPPSHKFQDNIRVLTSTNPLSETTEKILVARGACR